jgi:hypothetical protein
VPENKERGGFAAAFLGFRFWFVVSNRSGQGNSKKAAA